MNKAWMDEFEEIYDGYNPKVRLKELFEKKMEEARKEARDGVLHNTAETIEMVISTIALDQGWEETGDKYRKMYGLPMIYVKED